MKKWLWALCLLALPVLASIGGELTNGRVVDYPGPGHKARIKSPYHWSPSLESGGLRLVNKLDAHAEVLFRWHSEASTHAAQDCRWRSVEIAGYIAVLCERDEKGQMIVNLSPLEQLDIEYTLPDGVARAREDLEMIFSSLNFE